MSSDANRSPWKTYELGVITIELQSPFIIGAGESDGLFDATFVTDANGYPTIPGESLAGIMRHAAEADWGADVVRAVFGFQESDDGRASNLRVSFGCVHDRTDRPVPTRVSRKEAEERQADGVLSALAAGAGRDHVRIGAHGAVDGLGKFDERIVPAGARFSFEMCVSHLSPKRLADLVDVLRRAETHVGAGSRRGYGGFVVVRAHTTLVDLTTEAGLRRMKAIPVDLAGLYGCPELKPLAAAAELRKAAKSSDEWVVGRLTLTPVGTWMVGNGSTQHNLPSRQGDKGWDRVPLSETRIVWAETGGKTTGRVQAEGEAPWLLPGSSIKGAVRHRTGFHARCIAEEVKQPDAGPWRAADLMVTDTERKLFGSEAEVQKSPGRVFFSEVTVAPTQATTVGFQHVSLDRFTQAPLDHLLFDEVALGRCRLEIEIEVWVGRATSPYVTADDRKALQKALDDLCQGRLALGAGRGHGRFTGDLVWHGAPLYVEEKSA